MGWRYHQGTNGLNDSLTKKTTTNRSMFIPLRRHTIKFIKDMKTNKQQSAFVLCTRIQDQLHKQQQKQKEQEQELLDDDVSHPYYFRNIFRTIFWKIMFEPSVTVQSQYESIKSRIFVVEQQPPFIVQQQHFQQNLSRL